MANDSLKSSVLQLLDEQIANAEAQLLKSPNEKELAELLKLLSELRLARKQSESDSSI